MTEAQANDVRRTPRIKELRRQQTATPTQNQPQGAQRKATPPDATRRLPTTLAVGPTSSDVGGYQSNIHQWGLLFLQPWYMRTPIRVIPSKHPLSNQGTQKGLSWARSAGQNAILGGNLQQGEFNAIPGQMASELCLHVLAYASHMLACGWPLLAYG